MAFDPKRLRKWFAIAAALLLAIVIGFYSYARYKVNRAIRDLPEKIGANVEQMGEDFVFTKSDGGRKQFSISAKRAIQYKSGQRAALNDVRIVVYGRGGQSEQAADGYDQIYGKEFEYDREAGEVRANGDVMIDLERSGTPPVDPRTTQPQPGSIHLKTSGLVFNQKTGTAQTKERIEFSLPQASGSAVGAIYDAKDRTLTLRSQVSIRSAADSSRHSALNMNAATITASNAVITDAPRKIELASVHMEQLGREFDAQRLQIFLRGNSTVERALATGNVRAAGGDRGSGDRTTVRSAQAAFAFGAANALQDVMLTGGVSLDVTGNRPAHGTAGKVSISLKGRNRVDKVTATENVLFEQGNEQQAVAIQAGGIDFLLSANGGLTRAVTAGSSQIVIRQARTAATASQTTLTSDRFEARFDAHNRISSVHGENNSKVVFSGREPRTTTSREITAIFDPRSARNGELQSLEQAGDFQYTEGRRTAAAERARYVLADEMITLQGSPRVQDKPAGFAVTADTIRLNRRTNEAAADGNVKTTYSEMKPSEGAMLASGDPIHVTSANAQASSTGKARFAGAARLWQGPNIVQAPVIEFDRNRRWLQASTPGNDAKTVTTVFAQTDRSGRTTPVSVRADKLTYSDPDRRAVFEGGVAVSTADATIRASQIEILLHRQRQTGASSAGPSQLNQIIATGNLAIEQQNPSRRAAGDRLIYTASDGKFVLTGSQEKTPSIFDAERGEITGDSLTFFSRDGRVQVGSGENSRTVTRTRIKDETKP